MQKDKKNIVVVVQARVNSIRLPKKVLLDLEGKPVIIRIIERLLRSKKIDQVVVATTHDQSDAAIEKTVWQYYPNMPVFRGNVDDLVDRCYRAVKKYHPLAMVRIPADSPLVDWRMIDEIISVFLSSKADYVSNGLGVKTYPTGMDFELFSFPVLEKLWRELKDPKEREFPSLFIRENQHLFTCINITGPRDYSFHRWTLDEKDDYELIKMIYQKLCHQKPDFGMDDILALFEKNPELIKINQHVEQRWKNY